MRKENNQVVLTNNYFMYIKKRIMSDLTSWYKKKNSSSSDKKLISSNKVDLIKIYLILLKKALENFIDRLDIIKKFIINEENYKIIIIIMVFLFFLNLEPILNDNDLLFTAQYIYIDAYLTFNSAFIIFVFFKHKFINLKKKANKELFIIFELHIILLSVLSSTFLLYYLIIAHLFFINPIIAQSFIGEILKENKFKFSISIILIIFILNFPMIKQTGLITLLSNKGFFHLINTPLLFNANRFVSFPAGSMVVKIGIASAKGSGSYVLGCIGLGCATYSYIEGKKIESQTQIAIAKFASEDRQFAANIYRPMLTTQTSKTIFSTRTLTIDPRVIKIKKDSKEYSIIGDI